MKRLFSSKLNFRGFTLVETLVTTFILLLVSSIFLAVLTVGNDSWQINSGQTELQQEIRKAITHISDELRQSGASQISVEADGEVDTSAIFNVCNGMAGGNISWAPDSIQYALAGTELQRTEGGTDITVIAHNIASIEFIRESTTPEMVEVSLVAEKNTFKGLTITVSNIFDVNLRN